MKRLLLLSLPLFALVFFLPNRRQIAASSIAEKPEIPKSFSTLKTIENSDSRQVAEHPNDRRSAPLRIALPADESIIDQERVERAKAIVEKTRPQRVAAKPDQRLIGKGQDRRCDLECQKENEGYTVAGVVYRIGGQEREATLKKGDAKLKPALHLQLN